MLVRCERCRTVYRLTSSVTAARCGRCDLVFAPVALDVVPSGSGALGGAAAEPNRRDSLAALRASRPGEGREARRLSRRAIGWTVAGAAVLSLLLVFSRDTPRPAGSTGLSVPPEIAAMLTEAEVLIDADDEVSLERAAALLARAEAASPGRDDVAARVAFVALLRGLSVRAEIEDLTDALASGEKGAEDAKARLARLVPRSERWLAAAMRSTEALRSEDDRFSARAHALVDAMSGRRAALEVRLASAEGDAWLHYAMALALVAEESPPLHSASAAWHLDRARTFAPKAARFRWEHARYGMRTGKGRDASVRAELEAIAAAHPRHLGARRALARLGHRLDAEAAAAGAATGR